MRCLSVALKTSSIELWERQKAEKSEAEKLNAVKKMVCDGVISVENAMAYFGYSKEQILAKWRSSVKQKSTQRGAFLLSFAY